MAGKKSGKKSLKGQVANISTSFLRLVNVAVIAGGAASVVIMFVINVEPTAAGWGFIFLGIITSISGVFGTISSGQIGCFGCHLFGLFISAAGLCASFVVILLKTNSVLSSLHPTGDPSDAKQMLRIEGAIYLVLFSSQMVVLLLACMIHQCGLLEYYEDLDAISSAREVARLQQEEDARRAKSETSSAFKLAEKMKAKYGQWTNKNSDYDLESSQPVKQQYSG